MHVGMWVPQLRGILLVLLSAAITQVGGRIMLTTTVTLRSDHQVCPGDEVIFTCIVQGSQLRWSSEEYIGTGGKQFEFATVDDLNKTLTFSSTVAMLLSKSVRNGVQNIVSQLRIIASAMYPTSSVVCHDALARNQSVDFNIAVNPSSPPQKLLMNQSGCTFRLSWKILERANHYLVTIHSGNTVTKINETSNIIRYPLTADMIEIEIVAVNWCGQEGPNQTLQWSTDRQKCCNINMEPTPCRSNSIGTKFNDDVNNTTITTNSNNNIINVIISGSTLSFNIILTMITIIVLIVICILVRRRPIQNNQLYGSRSGNFESTMENKV